ncbi:hypothetical protein [Roseateles depolymerans]|nr:hypothetical protein [Roseateles depolymerans]
MPMHDDAASAMTPLAPPLRAASASPDLPEWPGGGGLAALGRVDRQRLAQQLRDPQHRFEMEDNAALAWLFQTAAPALPSWRDWPAVRWCTPDQTMQTPDSHPGPYLLVAPVWTDGGWELHSTLASDLHPEQTALPAHVPVCNKFRCPPHDLLDVVVQTIENARPRKIPGCGLAPQGGGAAPGSALRRELAQWLDTADEEAMMSAPSSLRMPGFPQRALGSPLHAVALLKRPLAAVSPPASPEPAASIAPAALPAPSAPAALSAPASQSIPSIPTSLHLRVLALAEQLRQGLWNDVLGRVAPMLMARLPSTHPLRLGKVDITFGDGRRLRTQIGEQGQPREVICDPQGLFVKVTSRASTVPPAMFAGSDALLNALIFGRYSSPAMAAGARQLLADRIEKQPLLPALILAILDRWPERNPELMLRFCLHGKTLQPAAQQLLGIAAPARDLTVEEVRQWQHQRPDMHWSQDQMLREGISVADYRWHFSPLGLSGNGVQLLQQHGFTPTLPRAKRSKDVPGVEQLKDALPSLRYEFGTMDELAKYLRLSVAMLKGYVGSDLLDAVEAYRYRMTWEECEDSPVAQMQGRSELGGGPVGT